MKKTLKLHFLIIGCCFNVMLAKQLDLSEVMKSYEQALQKLILVQQTVSPKSDQDLLSNPLILSTYKKLIMPSVVWINGYAHVVASQVAHKFDYFKDLATLVEEYKKHKTDVEKIILLFSQPEHQKALDVFHQLLQAIVLQTCFNIVQDLSNQNNVDAASIEAAYQAYFLAWNVKTKTLNIKGAGSAQAFDTVLIQNMITLLSNSLNVLQTSLTSNLSSGVSVLSVYNQLEQNYEKLYQIYQNIGNTVDAQNQKNLIAALQQQKKNYAQAQKVKQQAFAALQGAYKVIVLDVDDVATTVSNISQSLAVLRTAFASYNAAKGLFSTANDLIGKSECSAMILRIGDGDMLVRTVQNLWSLYLTDQSQTQDFYTFPTLQQFVTGQAAGQSDNAVQALQTLVGMCSDGYGDTNNVGPLMSTSYNALMLPIIQNVLSFLEQNPTITQKTDPLLNAALLSDVQIGLKILIDLCNTVINAVNNSDQSKIAIAMANAQLLDQLFLKNNQLDQYIPHLPDVFKGDATWVNFFAQFFYQAGLATSAAQAQALAGTVKISMPVTLTKKDLAAMQSKADALFAQAEVLEKTESFAQASALYEQAMVLYQKLYQHESDGLLQIKILTLANAAKTRFAATSFASIVQSSGAATLGQIKNIPTSYRATSYQFLIDATLMGGKLPVCLSSLTVGQTLKIFTPADQNDIFAFIKGYLVAQRLTDQGVIGSGAIFTNYFSDYTMSSVVTSSQRAQSAVLQISNYLNDFKNIELTSVTLESDSQVSIVVANFPLASLNPVCTALSSAATYFGAASDLFAPATAPISLGGQTYDPGDDLISQQIMLKNMGYAYLSAAQEKNIEFLRLIGQISASNIAAKGSMAKTLPKNFYAQYNQVQNLAISIQALLYGANAASGFFEQAGLASLAALVKAEFLNIYKKQIDFGKSCLIGDPTSNNYQMVVTSINQAYVSWAAELDNLKDAALVTNINTKIAKLYEFAGQECLNYAYTDPEFANFNQVHYMVAAQYYKSAMAQYQSLQNVVKVAQLKTKINGMYYQACVQNLNLYFHVKKYGAVYTSQQTGTQRKITFQQLLSDFNDGSIGGGAESDLYQKVQNLLLDGAMVFEFLSGHAKSRSTNATATTAQGANNKVIVQFLQKNNLLKGVTVSAFSQIPLSLTEKIIQLASVAYAQFRLQPELFASWNNLMFMMVKNMYNMDYQAIVATSSSNQINLATQQFLSAISNEASSLQNPSEGYIQ